MYIDYAFINTDLNDNSVKEIISEIIDLNINSITVPFYLLKNVKNLYNKPIVLSCLIDYPLGISDLKTRRCAVEQAHKTGANCIDISMPQNLAANRKYDKIREDIKCISEYCNEYNVEIRYILEYRVFDHHCLKKICEIFDNTHIKYAYPSSGYFLDNLADNILASIFLHQNSKDLNVLSTGNMWQNKHFETLIKSGVFGFRTSCIHSLKNFVTFNLMYNDKNGV
jgi:deoxyribose-phosphate aldolase